MRIELRWRVWHGDEPLALEFLEQFTVSVHPPRDGADIGPEGVRDAFAAPIGTLRIRELAQRRKSAVIVDEAEHRPRQPSPRHRLCQKGAAARHPAQHG